MPQITIHSPPAKVWHALTTPALRKKWFFGVETKTGFYTDGKLYSMSNSLEFLRFPPLGLLSKLRLGATIFGQSIHLLMDEAVTLDQVKSDLARDGFADVEMRTITPSLEDVFVTLTHALRE